MRTLPMAIAMALCVAAFSGAATPAAASKVPP